MENEIKASLNAIYLPSEDMVVKEIQGEFVIVPLRAGMVDLEDEFFKLTRTARAMWDKLSAGKTLKKIAQELSLKYEESPELIEKDLLQLAKELLKRRILIAVRRD